MRRGYVTVGFLLVLCVGSTAGQAADFTVTLTAEETALATRLATAQGTIPATLIQDLCRVSLQTQRTVVLQRRLEDLREQYFSLPDTRFEAVDQAVQQALEQGRR